MTVREPFRQTISAWNSSSRTGIAKSNFSGIR